MPVGTGSISEINQPIFEPNVLFDVYVWEIGILILIVFIKVLEKSIWFKMI